MDAVFLRDSSAIRCFCLNCFWESPFLSYVHGAVTDWCGVRPHQEEPGACPTSFPASCWLFETGAALCCVYSGGPSNPCPKRSCREVPNPRILSLLAPPSSSIRGSTYLLTTPCACRRSQAGQSSRSGAGLQGAKSILADEGVGGLYTGYSSNIAYAFPADAIKFLVRCTRRTA